MPSWVSSFKKHEIWNALGALRGELDEVHPDADADDARDTLEYVAELVAILEAYRGSANPLLLTPARLTATQAQLNALAQAVLTWKAADLESPEAVDTAVGAVVDTMSSWPALRADQEEDAVNAAISTMSKATDDALAQLTAGQQKLTEQQEQLSETQGGLEKAAAALDAANKKTIEGLTESWKAAQQQRSNEGDAAVEELRGLRGEAQKMVHESTSLMVGTEYAEQAGARRRSARWYDGGAVAFGVVGVIALLVYVLRVQPVDETVGFAITRLGLSLGAFLIGGFLATRGREQHREARELQRTALALSRMAPFVANLDSVAQEVLTVETADRIFVRGELGEVTKRESALDKLRARRAADAAEAEAEEA